MVESFAYNEKVIGSSPLLLNKMGALTLKTFSDELREWEFIEAQAFDPTDSFGTLLKLSIRENQIFLAEPNDINTVWLTDKGRLFFDGMFKNFFNNKLVTTNWKMLFKNILEIIYFVDHLNFHKQNKFSLIFVFENLSIETLNILYLLKKRCSFVELRQIDNCFTSNNLESQYQLDSHLVGKTPKLFMSTLGILINTNTRYEGYVLNIAMRQRFLKGNFKLLVVGSILNLTFPTYNLGSNFSILKFFSEGTHLSCQDIKSSDFPVFITNSEVFKRTDATIFLNVLNYANMLNTAWTNVNILNNSISKVGTMSLNKFLPFSSEDYVTFFGLYFVGVSLNSSGNIKKLIELHMLQIFKFNTSWLNKTLIYQNFSFLNNDTLLNKNNLFNTYFYLPNKLFLEDNETYINTQGTIKRSTKLINFKKNSKTNWQLIRKFYANTKLLMCFNNKIDNALISFDLVNSFHFKNYIAFQYWATQTLTNLSFFITRKNLPLPKKLYINLRPLQTKVLDTKLKNWLDDFFYSSNDFFTYGSTTLVNCSKTNRFSSTNFF